MYTKEVGRGDLKAREVTVFSTLTSSVIVAK